jgi:hypothetical protein
MLLCISSSASFGQFSTAPTLEASKTITPSKADPKDESSDAVRSMPITGQVIGLSHSSPEIVKARKATGGGELCDDDATLIRSLPFQDSGNTCDSLNDYNTACDFPASGPDVVYRYEAEATVEVDISLCGNPEDEESGSTFDTTLFVYWEIENGEDVCTSSPYACNEDFCAQRGQPEMQYVSALSELTFWAGFTYYIVIDGYGGECGDYTLDVIPHIEVPTCDEDALAGQSPSSPMDDWDAPMSDGDYGEEGIRVYESLVGVHGAVNAVTWWGLESRYDQELHIDVPCEREDRRFEIAFYADAQGHPGRPAETPLEAWTVRARRSEVQYRGWTLRYGDFALIEYYAEFPPVDVTDATWISVQGVNSNQDDCYFQWMGSEDGDGRCYQQSGSNTPILIGTDVSYCIERTFEQCFLECPPESVPEDEPCGDDTNGGCNMFEPAFTSIALDPMQEITVCGTQWAHDWWRDTDWYAVKITEPTYLTMTVLSEMPVVFGFVRTEPCGSTDCEDTFGWVWPGMWSWPCQKRSVSQSECLPPGTYWLFVGPGTFSGYPCREPGDNLYVMTVSGEPCEVVTGACCQLDGTCALTTECQCEGFYSGDNTLCEEVECPQIPTNDDCATAEIISELPAVVQADTRLASDDPVPPCDQLWFGPYKNVWYQVTGTGNVMTATTCSPNTEVFDTKIGVFCASCEDPLCVAGNDDDFTCEQYFQSSVSWCSKEGAIYYITVGGYSIWTEPGLIELTVTDEGESCTEEIGCPLDLPNDECASAQPISRLPASVRVDTRRATDDEVAPCGDVAEMYQNVWYELIGTGETLTASTCNEATAVLDTAISVFCGSCEEAICVGGNNDAGSCDPAELSSVSWCSEEGAVYYISVGSASSETAPGAIHLDVTSDGVLCEGAVPCGRPPPEPGPVLVRAESQRSHGTSGSFSIGLSVSGTPAIEPRQNGNWANMILYFDMEIEAEDGSFDCGDEILVTNGECVAIIPSTDSLTVRMDYDRNACVHVQVEGIRAFGEGSPLEGDNDVEVICHEGDVNRDGNVNVIDLQDIKNRVFQVTTFKNFIYDVDVSGGTLNVIDLQETKNNLFSWANCP